MTSLWIPVGESSQVGDARRQVTRLAAGRGLGEEMVGRVALVVTELAGNLAKHTPQGGELLVRPLGDSGVEVLALDRGPGMESVARCLQDGYSTAGSPGTGLGAVSRLADEFQIYSRPGLGTAILARVGAAPPTGGAALRLGVVNRAKAGQEVSGDGWTVAWRPGPFLLLVADGLGHGPGAALAVTEAIRAFHEHAARPPVEILEHMHLALRATRGAAVALAALEPSRDELRFVGIGNINGVVLTGDDSRSTISHNGIVGHEMRRVQEFAYPWTRESVLVVHSDGLQARWDLGRYPGLLSRDPALVAGVLYRDFCRGNDDTTVVVVRERSASEGMESGG